MKKKIRINIFESNSSSTHSLTLCLKSDYDKWLSGEVLLCKGSGYRYPKNNRPKRNHFYTKEQAIEFEKGSIYSPGEDFDWSNELDVMELLHDNEWYEADYYFEYFEEEYETFEDDMTTPNGEVVVAFGYYG